MPDPSSYQSPTVRTLHGGTVVESLGPAIGIYGGIDGFGDGGGARNHGSHRGWWWWLH